jgi:hypothetical protein
MVLSYRCCSSSLRCIFASSVCVCLDRVVACLIIAGLNTHTIHPLLLITHSVDSVETVYRLGVSGARCPDVCTFTAGFRFNF